MRVREPGAGKFPQGCTAEQGREVGARLFGYGVAVSERSFGIANCLGTL